MSHVKVFCFVSVCAHLKQLGALPLVVDAHRAHLLLVVVDLASLRLLLRRAHLLHLGESDEQLRTLLRQSRDLSGVSECDTGARLAYGLLCLRELLGVRCAL